MLVGSHWDHNHTRRLLPRPANPQQVQTTQQDGGKNWFFSLKNCIIHIFCCDEILKLWLLRRTRARRRTKATGLWSTSRPRASSLLARRRPSKATRTTWRTRTCPSARAATGTRLSSCAPAAATSGTAAGSVRYNATLKLIWKNINLMVLISGCCLGRPRRRVLRLISVAGVTCRNSHPTMLNSRESSAGRSATLSRPTIFLRVFLFRDFLTNLLQFCNLFAAPTIFSILRPGWEISLALTFECKLASILVDIV